MTTVNEFIVPGWMRPFDGARLQLVGQRCPSCHTTAFPKATACQKCGSLAVEEKLLGPTAELFSVTVDRLGYPLGHAYLIGQVRFRNGPIVQGFVVGDVDAPPPIGSPVTLVRFEVPNPKAKTSQMFTTYAFSTEVAKHA